MRLTATSNIDQVLQDMDRFVDQVQRVAAVRTLNKLRDQAQTAGQRKIADIYDIGPRTMDKYTSTGTAAGDRFEASITVKGKGFPLSDFQPIKTSKGISVKIKGKRYVVPHSFFTPRTNQRVFARGAYVGKGLSVTTGSFGNFVFGRSKRITRPRAKRTELPINQLWTLGPATAFGNDDVVTAMHDRVDEQAAKVLAQEIRFARRAA